MIYDVRTQNISFLKVSKILRLRGVKNNKFMLALYDETLVGVDPRSKEVQNSPELQLRIYREICRNVWYYLREVVRIPADGAEIRYELNIANATMAFLKLQNRNIIEIICRQHGKTMSNIVFDSWSLMFITKNANYAYINKGLSDAKKNLKIFKDVKACLPKWLLEMYVEDAKNDIDNQENKLIAKRNNSLKVVSTGSDPDAADKSGRGLTIANVYWDEFSFTKYCDITYQAAIHAFKRASENARKNGTPYGFIITTTPANLDTQPGAYCKLMIDKSAVWKLDLFDMTTDEITAYIKANSSNNFIFVQYTYKELGRDDEWLKETIRDCQGDLSKVKREVLLEWPKSMESSVFNEEQLDKIYQFVKQPVTSIYTLSKQYCIDWYETPDVQLNYILSCDVAGGLSRDSSTIVFIHPEDFRVVADFKSNKIDTDSFKKLIIELMTFYFPNSLLVIERNSYGLNLIQSLMKNPKIEPRMYREVRESVGEKTVKDGFTVKRKSNTVAYGVDTNAASRKQMLDMLPEIVDVEYDKIVSPNIYRDISTLERKKTGKIEHSVSGHDDSLMAYLIFRYAVFYGKCFRDKFGIHPVPSRMNVKSQSSISDLARISSLIERVNSDASSQLSNNSTYNYLMNQSRKLNSESDSQLDAFMRIANLNK